MNTIQSTSGTVTFRLKETNALKETPILFDYSYGRGNRLKYSTGYKTLVKNWDPKNQKIRSISTISNREEINKRLLKIKSDFVDAVTKMDEEDKSNKEALKSIFDQIMGRKTGAPTNNIKFIKYGDDFVEANEKNSITTASMKLSPGTVRSYKQTMKQIKKFNKENNYQLDFDKIDMTFYYAFVSFLEKEGFSLNTIGKHIKNVIALLNRATEDGINTNLKYKHRDFKRVSEKTTSIYLTAKEIDELYKLDLSHNKEWERARDIFLIGYYTGQRVSDYNGLNNNHIKIFDGKEVFEIFQKKTKKTVFIPIHHRIKEIMTLRYNGNLPKKLSDQHINEYIKKIGRKAKIKENVMTKITIGGAIKEETIPKHKLIGTHTARRSFCTNAYLSKMPVIDIMSLSGHTTEKEFYNYIKVTPQERAIKIADSTFFNSQI
ncbi:phage integrase SAM-like domain-containing protein [Confluentibacter citreus]|uniref:phage integrase SAM-like domain-containing protein n=1 Tax=Confluentibacter citreus TaxID=2007307 RepID=UPI000C2827AC|nr:phage integrase SAM-like domain-containing protein [Confluentibacter citreus]